MLSTKSLVSNLDQIPREWPFEYYLNLTEKLTGQDIKIKSVFNINDKNPSFCIFFSTTTQKYKFKDFSTDITGDGVCLVQNLFHLSTRGEAAYKLLEDYNHYMLTSSENYSLREFKVQQKYKVSDFLKRGWTNLDSKFWTQFHIGSKDLEFYNVFPLEYYTMEKEDNGELKELKIEGFNIYGYFRKDGSLYKIYQPYLKENKFIKVRDYIQGSDQLTLKVPYLVILSSLKDIMAFKTLKFKNVEVIAPDSENILIAESYINSYKHKYTSICTLFDNDEAGIRAMQKYKDKYDLPFVHLNLSKDLSDSIRDLGSKNVREVLQPLLTEVLTPKT
jgi:hypothetical protein